MIAVLAGGPSCEREVSLVSGRAVFDALRSKGIDAVIIDPADNVVDEIKKAGATAAFIALHGSFGEDGTIQKLLEEGGIAYTGSGVEASRRAFDKSIAQSVFKERGLRVPDFLVIRKGDSLPAENTLGYPLVVKPATCGSSVGISILKSGDLFREACAKAREYSDTILLERYIQGRELTVGLLGGQVLPAVEVVPLRSFYDYQAKYQDTGTRYECPAKLSASEAQTLKEMALESMRELGCSVLCRADFILAPDGRPYLLEVNTIPGLTGKSLLPKAAKAAGIDFPDLCVRILQLSLEKAKVKELG